MAKISRDDRLQRGDRDPRVGGAQLLGRQQQNAQAHAADVGDPRKVEDERALGRDGRVQYRRERLLSARRSDGRSVRQARPRRRRQAAGWRIPRRLPRCSSLLIGNATVLALRSGPKYSREQAPPVSVRRASQRSRERRCARPASVLGVARHVELRGAQRSEQGRGGPVVHARSAAGAPCASPDRAPNSETTRFIAGIIVTAWKIVRMTSACACSSAPCALFQFS